MNKINNLILENMSLAEKIAKFKKKTTHSSVSYDELKSAAYFGLTEAANSFDPSYEVPFCLYAFRKIVWSIKNYLRELCWGKKTKKIESFDLSKIIKNCSDSWSLFYFDLDILDDLQKKIVLLKLQMRMKNREIANLLNYSESRISQILSDIKRKLTE